MEDTVAEEASALVRLFYSQIFEGCRNEACVAKSCRTYRARVSDGQARAFSILAARAIAFSLASRPDAVELLCHDSRGRHLGQTDLSQDENIPDIITMKDRKSMSQQLFDTKVMRDLFSVGVPDKHAADMKLYKQFDKNIKLILALMNLELSDDLKKGLRVLTSSCITMILLRAHGVKKKVSDAFATHVTTAWLDDIVLLRMTAQLVHVISHVRCPASTTNLDTVKQLNDHLCNSLQRSRHNVSLLFETFAVCFLNHWSGTITVPIESVAGHALTCMDWLETSLGPIYQDIQYLQRLISDQLDLIEIARFQTYKPDRPADSGNIMSSPMATYPIDHLPLIVLPWLFSKVAQASIFRARRLQKMTATTHERKIRDELIRNFIMSEARGDVRRTNFVRRILAVELAEDEPREGEAERVPSILLFSIRLRRTMLLQDMFDALWRRTRTECLLPLRIQLDDTEVELGQDLGGVAQELMGQCWKEALSFNQASQGGPYSFFVELEGTNLMWFSAACLEPSYKYQLLGVILALSIHNGFILPVSFPLALYRTLLGATSHGLDDIQDGWPDRVKHFREWDESWEMSFDFETYAYGKHFSFDMKADREDPPSWDIRDVMAHGQEAPHEGGEVVTAAMLESYISLWIAWTTEVSVRYPLRAFVTGFHSLISPGELEHLSPEALRLLVEGENGAKLDFVKLAEHTEYLSGYSPESKTIKDFWIVASSWEAIRKRQFLQFVFASDRLPLQGEQGLSFKIQKTNYSPGGDSVPLPTASTCFATLCLPDYGSIEVLKAKVEQALELAPEGFGLA